MPTPTFTIRLSREKQEELKDLAKVYGAESASAFTRELLTAILSGDGRQIAGFAMRLQMKIGEQLQLQLGPQAGQMVHAAAAVEAGRQTQEGVQKARKKKKGVRRAP